MSEEEVSCHSLDSFLEVQGSVVSELWLQFPLKNSGTHILIDVSHFLLESYLLADEVNFLAKGGLLAAGMMIAEVVYG